MQDKTPKLFLNEERNWKCR